MEEILRQLREEEINACLIHFLLTQLTENFFQRGLGLLQFFNMRSCS